MTTRPLVLKAAKLPDEIVSALCASLEVVELPEDDGEIAALLQTCGSRIRGIAVRKREIRAALLDRLPALEIVASYSAGLENVDTEHCRQSGITVTNTSHILAEEVANLTVLHCLAVTRQLVRAHEFVRSEAWTHGQFPLTHSLSGMEVGIVGLGHIGKAIARRLEVMGARVSYYGPRKKSVELPYFDSPEALAEATQMLVVSCPLSGATRGLVSREVIAALGPDGYLVNISRGPIVDEDGLIAALEAKQLAGAALDVFEHEPHVPEALRTHPSVILTPHIGSGTEETRRQMGLSMVQSLREALGA
ncbi:MAG: 2-hydroxyacid dehydrogenase [Pelagibaca sp.]|nr:2-hydroxyacid dehydrogenase [Pelagibaca sp.]